MAYRHLSEPGQEASISLVTADIARWSEFVIRGANVLSMDPNIGDFAAGDVHMRDGAIVAVAPRIDRTNVQIIEAGNMICMPGFVDTHWHLWTSLLRPFIRADVDELGYFPVSFRLGQLFTPEDSYRSVLLGLAEALSAGVTTVHNWANNVRSPDHADAELSAMRDAGIRGRFAYGPALGMPDDQPMDMAGLARVKRDWMPGDGLLTCYAHSVRTTSAPDRQQDTRYGKTLGSARHARRRG
jgi:5-methylthioadenosine/S-adenosylhomocysteine deaminase